MNTFNTFCPVCKKSKVSVTRWKFADTSVDVPACKNCATSTGIASASVKVSSMMFWPRLVLAPDLEPGMRLENGSTVCGIRDHRSSLFIGLTDREGKHYTMEFRRNQGLGIIN